MDVIEIPSHFMESFMKDPRIVQQFARHHCSEDVLPAGLVEQVVQNDKQFGALDMEVQVGVKCVSITSARLLCELLPGYCARLLCQVTVTVTVPGYCASYCARLLCQLLCQVTVPDYCAMLVCEL